MNRGEYIGISKEFKPQIMMTQIQRTLGEFRVKNIQAESRHYADHAFFFIFLTIDDKIPDEVWDNQREEFIKFFPPGECTQEFKDYLTKIDWVKL